MISKGSFNKSQSNPPSADDSRPNKPVGEIRIGSIRAAIWARPYENGVAHNVTFSRLYKQGDEWRRSESFSRDDLLVVAKVADLAHTWILEQQNARSSREP